MKRIIAHVDMDCFFCSCEEKYDPLLKGKPVIVGGISERGVVAAANYESRKFGVFSATPIRIAKKLCPTGIFLKGNMNLYKQESNAIMDVLNSFSDELVKASIDEAYLDLTSFSNNFSSLEEMGIYIKNTVKEKTGLTCSIGISNCRITSKIASDYDKPDGLTIVTNQRSFLKSLPIKKIPGIGSVTVNKYTNKGIYTIGDLAIADKFKLLDIGGLYAIKFQQLALGDYQAKLKKPEGRKSISAERTFEYDTRDKTKLENTIDNMCEKIHSRVENKYFKTVSIKLRYDNFKTITRDFSLHTMTNSLDLVKELAYKTLNQNYHDEPIRLIGVKLSNFIHESNKQTTLASFV